MPEQPTSYFKYLSVAGATAVLANRTLRWSTCALFNDPSDMQTDLAIDCDRDVVISRTLDLMWLRCEGKRPPGETNIARAFDRQAAKFFALGREEFDERLRPGILGSIENVSGLVKKFSDEFRGPLGTTKVLCFSDRKDSNLMCSHYAQSHTGLVLEFRNLVDGDSPYKSAEPIQYSSMAPQFTDVERLARILSGEEVVSDEMTKSMVFTKADEWSYEREWRLQTGNGREPSKSFEDVPFAARELHAAFFGCKADQQTKNLLEPLIRHRYPEAEIWQARRETHTYHLRFDRVAIA